MVTVLIKGQNINLAKENPSLNQITLGLGWINHQPDDVYFDLDAVCFLVDDKEKCASETDFVFYGNLRSTNGAVVRGHNRNDDSDEEKIDITLNAVPAQCKQCVIAVTIHEAEIRKQHFGMVSDLYIRIVDKITGQEKVRFNLTEDYNTNTALIFAKLYRHDGDWYFQAVGQGLQIGLPQLVTRFGLGNEKTHAKK